MTAAIGLMAFGFVVGAVAQIWKRRLGAFWMMLAMAVVGGGGQWSAGLMARRYDPSSWSRSEVRRPVQIVAHAVPAVFIILAVALVPPKRRPERPSAFPTDDKLRRKCPHCAEMILAEARVCQHCGGRVRPILEAPDLPTLPSGPPTPPPPKRTD